jgi:hypothetical protein
MELVTLSPCGTERRTYNVSTSTARVLYRGRFKMPVRNAAFLVDVNAAARHRKRPGHILPESRRGFSRHGKFGDDQPFLEPAAVRTRLPRFSPSWLACVGSHERR